MTKAEIDTFIEHMEEIGDVWDTADVERVYVGHWKMLLMTA